MNAHNESNALGEKTEIIGRFTQESVHRATRGADEYLLKISVLLTSVGKTSREAMTIKKPAKIVEKLSVNFTTR